MTTLLEAYRAWMDARHLTRLAHDQVDAHECREEYDIDQMRDGTETHETLVARTLVAEMVKAEAKRVLLAALDGRPVAEPVDPAEANGFSYEVRRIRMALAKGERQVDVCALDLVKPIVDAFCNEGWSVTVKDALCGMPWKELVFGR